MECIRQTPKVNLVCTMTGDTFCGGLRGNMGCGSAVRGSSAEWGRRG